MLVRWPLVVVLLLGVCAGQTATNKLPEPDSIGVFFYLDPGSQTLKRLPKEEWKRHRGAHFSTVTEDIDVPGAGSSFRIASHDKATFVFKVFKDEDAGKMKLFHFDVKGQGRQYELAKWHGRDSTQNTGIPINVSKFGESSYALTPENPLQPGEYAIAMGQWVFTFSVN